MQITISDNPPGADVKCEVIDNSGLVEGGLATTAYELAQQIMKLIREGSEELEIENAELTTIH